MMAYRKKVCVFAAVVAAAAVAVVRYGGRRFVRRPAREVALLRKLPRHRLHGVASRRHGADPPVTAAAEAADSKEAAAVNGRA